MLGEYVQLYSRCICMFMYVMYVCEKTCTVCPEIFNANIDTVHPVLILCTGDKLRNRLANPPRIALFHPCGTSFSAGSVVVNVLFGIGFWGNIHSIAYFIVVQVRTLHAYVTVICVRTYVRMYIRTCVYTCLCIAMQCCLTLLVSQYIAAHLLLFTAHHFAIFCIPGIVHTYTRTVYTLIAR